MPDSQTYAPPSDEFMNVICNMGTPSATCGFCGMTTFARGGSDMDEGEYEKLIAQAVAEPTKFREDPQNDSIGVGEFGGYLFVWGCPCNKARRYEEFLWLNHATIMEYFRRRHAKELADVLADSSLIAEVSDAR